ncbi:MAG: HDOD domain-containing protein [Gammaproteobacteria bacterium]|nr:HDOD domain-containing protein [Gammaproteobacteria bacterium]
MRTHAAAPGQGVAAQQHSAALDFVEALGHDVSSGQLALPSFPDALLRIRDVVSNPGTPMDRVVQAAQTEPVFTARLIRMANSVLYSRGENHIADVGAAVARLGCDTIRNVAVAEATRQLLFSEGHRALRPYLRDLWEHSVRVAALAAVLARRLRPALAEQALIGGLLHDIGKLYILTRAKLHPELFADPLALGDLLAEWHPVVGRIILEGWDMPEQVALAAEEHETVDREMTGRVDVVEIVTAANLIANRGVGRAGGDDAAVRAACVRLGIDIAEVARLVHDDRSGAQVVADALRL